MPTKVNQERIISTSFLVVICIVICVCAGHRYLNKPADSAFMAMAHGQYSLAGEYYGEEADQGNPRALNALANLHYLGLGVEQDFEKAAELYMAAASKGFAPAQVNLGNLFSQGLGVRQDPMRAFAWYQQSNIQGHPIAEFYLRQIAVEYTLTPLQISTVREKWSILRLLVEEGL